MNSHGHEVILAFVAATIVLTILVIFLLGFAQLFQRRQAQFRAEKQALHESYQREILQAQIETQNQTLLHVSEELHDNIGQILSVVRLQLNVLDDELTDTRHHEAAQQAGDLVGQALNDLRSLSKSLNTDVIGRNGLVASIAIELERIEKTGRYKTHLLGAEDLPELDKQVEIVLLRMVQESLSNALKHARARTLTVGLERETATLKVTISDDGQGFQLNNEQATGSGVANLQRRATLLGGSCSWHSEAGSGTTVTILLPFT